MAVGITEPPRLKFRARALSRFRTGLPKYQASLLIFYSLYPQQLQ